MNRQREIEKETDVDRVLKMEEKSYGGLLS